MTRHVLMTDLKDAPGTIERYRVHHERVWPEVLQSLRSVGVERMDIYLLGRRLVMILDMIDGRDFRAALAQHTASNPKVGEWEALMKSMQEPPPGAPSGQWWALMEPVFELNGVPLSR